MRFEVNDLLPNEHYNLKNEKTQNQICFTDLLIEARNINKRYDYISTMQNIVNVHKWKKSAAVLAAVDVVNLPHEKRANDEADGGQ